DVFVIREREKRERNTQRILTRLRMEVKPDACRKEEKPQSDECEIRPTRGAKRQCAEHDKDDDGQSPEHSLRRLTSKSSVATATEPPELGARVLGCVEKSRRGFYGRRGGVGSSEI